MDNILMSNKDLLFTVAQEQRVRFSQCALNCIMFIKETAKKKKEKKIKEIR